MEYKIELVTAATRESLIERTQDTLNSYSNKGYKVNSFCSEKAGNFTYGLYIIFEKDDG